MRGHLGLASENKLGSFGAKMGLSNFVVFSRIRRIPSQAK